MLQRYAGRDIAVHLGSYLTFDYPKGRYTYIMASATLHRLIDEEKRELYPKLREALTDDGCLILGDYFVSPELAAKRLREYRELIASGVDLRNGKYHFDVPTTVENEKALLAEAGFASIETVWQSANYTILQMGRK